jgi:hypothetical protein
MTLHFFKLPILHSTVFYIPPRFLESKTSEKNYKTLMFFFQIVFQHFDNIISFLKRYETLTDSEKELKFRVMDFKECVIEYRRKYVVSTWRPADSERLHNEMTVKVSNLSQEHKQIGDLLKQVKASRK